MIIVIIALCLVILFIYVDNRIAYKELCNLEKNEKLSAELKLNRLKILGLSSISSIRSQRYIQKHNKLYHEFSETAYKGKPLGKHFTIISYGMDNEPTVVYDNATFVMYAVSFV